MIILLEGFVNNLRRNQSGKNSAFFGEKMRNSFDKGGFYLVQYPMSTAVGAYFRAPKSIRDKQSSFFKSFDLEDIPKKIRR